ncbi:MAG: hypothetical protein ACRDH5_03055, partial [bacterium]
MADQQNVAPLGGESSGPDRRIVTGGEPFGDLEQRAEDLSPCLGGLSGSGPARVEDALRTPPSERDALAS